MQKILAIIVTYNGMRWYERCLNSLRQSTIPLDVLVIDNASSDGSADWIAEHYPEVQLLRFARNLGFGQANNIGLKRVLNEGYDFAFLLNQDAWLYANDCIEQLVNAAKEHKDYAILSALWLYGSGEYITRGSEQHMIAMQKQGNDFMSDLFLKRPLLSVYETDYIGAAAWLLPRKTIEEIGGFDPIFFHRGEDDNYMQRVHFHGKKIGICPLACVCHDIEDRPKDYDSLHETWEKNLLIELADICGKLSLKQWKLVYMKKAWRQVACMRWSKARRNFAIARFIADHSSQIQRSIDMNKTIGAHWL